MPYTAAFEFDLFVSYASVDDLAFPGSSDPGWVTVFVQGLEAVLASRMGGRERLKIYFDRKNLFGNHQLEELRTAIKQSALFLSITSPGYVDREWTRKELETFLAGGADLRRLFCVEYLPLDETEQHPPPLDTHKRLRFWERDHAESAIAMPIPGNKDAFRSRLHDLADQIKKQLVAMKNAEGARPLIERAAKLIADDTKGVIYLAQSTDDLEEERLQIERYFAQYGYSVEPKVELPGGGTSFRQTVKELMEPASLYLQLLGPRAGRRPADLPEGYGAAQLQIAQALGKKTLIWRHPELDVDAIADAEQRKLLTDEHVVACGLRQFMDQARHELEELEASAEKLDDKPFPPSLVFINAIRNDYEIAKIAQQEFTARNLSTVIPLYDGPAEDVQRDLTENMKECDVIVFIYGDAPPSWVRSQMRLFSKLRPGKPARTVAIFVGPPDEKSADVGFALPGLRPIDFRTGWSAEGIRKIVAELGV